MPPSTHGPACTHHTHTPAAPSPPSEPRFEHTHPSGTVLLSTDQALLDVGAIHAALAATYWSPAIPRSFVERALRGSLCFGLYDIARGREQLAQIGLARVITDRATFAYLCDVYILESRRGHGLGTWMMTRVVQHPDLQNLRRFCLFTRDAHALYAKFGFAPMPEPARYMERLDRDVYKRLAAT